MISDSTHRAIVGELRERVVYLEAELARRSSENRDLVNTLATQARVPRPFKPVSMTDVLTKQPHMNGFKSVSTRQRELERATAVPERG